MFDSLGSRGALSRLATHPASRAAIQLAWRARRLALRVLKVRTRGVKVIVEDAAGAVLLVLNGYGDRAHWVLPGGGVKRGEVPADAGAREVLEETACVVTDLRPVGEYRSTAEGKRDAVSVFHGRSADVPVADGVEVVAARFFAVDALPGETSQATRRRIAEWRGERVSDGRW